MSKQSMAGVLGVVGLVAGAVLAGCSTGEYVGDGDTGRAAPATVRDMSETQRAGDSTAGHSRRTGRPGIAGDTLGRRSGSQSAPRPRTP